MIERTPLDPAEHSEQESTSYPKAISSRADVFIMQIPVITTGHWTYQDYKILEYAAQFVQRRDDGEVESVIVYLGDVEVSSVSKAGKEVLKHLRGLGYSHVRLDGELGSDLPGFKLHNW